MDERSKADPPPLPELTGEPRRGRRGRDTFDQIAAFPPDLPREVFLAHVFRHVTDVVFVLRVEPGDRFVFTSVNPAFTEITGVPEAAVVGQDARDVIPSPSVDMVLDNYRRAIRTQATARWNETTKYPKGIRHGEVSVTPVFADDGSCSHLVGAVRDVTEQRETEQALRKANERLEMAQAISHSGFLDWDLVTNELICSDEVYRWYGVSRQEAPTSPEFVAKVVHPDDLEYTRENLEAAIRGEKDYDIDHRIMTPDGVVRWVRAQAELIRDADGNPSRLLGTMVDITERKLAQDRIQELNANLERRVAERTAELQAANEELTSFSYSVSHDLRAPLRHINGYIDLLRREADGRMTEKADRYMGVITDAGREMAALIDDLLAYSRMANWDMHERPCRPNAIIDAVQGELGPILRERAIDWSVAALPTVMADPGMLKLVFTNLIENAVKFTRPRQPARIEIGAREDGPGETTIFVKDNGVGFESRYKDKLFGVFQRLHRADEFEGTGIGLANVRRIITRHGGRVWADGDVDQGATLYFTLKLAPPTTPAEEGSKT